MRKAKQLFALALASALTLSTAMPVFADPTDTEQNNPTETTYELTISYDQEGHTYDAYQIFTGTLFDGTNDDDDATNGIILSNIGWGKALVNDPNPAVEGEEGEYNFADDFVAALLTDTHEIKYKSNNQDLTTTLSSVFSSVEYNAADPNHSADAIADILSGGLPSAVVDHFATLLGKAVYDGAGEFENHLYLGKESGTSVSVTGGYKISNLPVGYYLVKDQENSQDYKDDFYTKYLLSIVHSTTMGVKGDTVSVTKGINKEVGGTYGDAASFDIGDYAYFKLEGELPTNFSSYDEYEYRFVDIMPDGLTFRQFEQIYIENIDRERVFTILDKTDDTEANDNFNTEWGIVHDDTPEDEDGVSIQGFRLTFPDLKEIYSGLSSDNKIIVKYSALVNREAPMNEAMTNEVYVEFDNSPDGNGLGKTPSDYAHAFTHTITIDKYETNNVNNKLEGVEFYLYFTRTYSTEGVSDVEEDGEGEGPSTPSITTKYYYAQVITEEMIEKGEEVNGKVVTEKDLGVVYGWTEDKAEASVLDTDNKGSLRVEGLDVGRYYLEEIKTNPGFNLLKNDVEVVITATYVDETTQNASVTMKYSVNNSTPTESETVAIENSRGNTLPTTGGMGTTLFYVIGGLMALVAVVLLITKKRMNIEA